MVEASSGDLAQTSIAAFVALLLTAAAIAVLVRRVPVPYVTALAVVGAVVGLAAGGHRPALTSSVILFIVLPGLLFESAFNIPWSQLRRDLVPIIVLATLGVALTTLVIAVVGHAVLGLPTPIAILFGAAVAPTDPVAIVAVFRRLGVPARLTTIVEAESLLNDGTGVVAFSLALSAATGGSIGPGSAMLQFAQLALGGLVLGATVGLLLSWLTARIDDPQVELTYTAIGAYGTYLLAETIHLSGILAVVAAAAVLGNYGRTRGMSETTRAAVCTVWEYVAFLLNSAIFLLIGLSTPWGQMAGEVGSILGASVITLVARAVAVYTLFLPMRLSGHGIPLKWQHIVLWSGMRGAVAVALVLSLAEQSAPGFEKVRLLVYGIVLLSILIQGTSIGPVSRRLLLRRSASPDG